ncbi:MAG: response regulator [Treponema sp.]|nr:response regulator [Treponema sp.]
MYSVFIVDDEMIVREGLRNKLPWESAGFSFAGEAGDGELALSMIQDIKPDILITDIRMPFMDGLELAAKAKKMQPWIRIIILSGHDEFDYAKRAISIGVEDYILKPFTLEELTAGLEKVAHALDEQRKQAFSAPRAKELESQGQFSRTKLLTDFVYGTKDAQDARCELEQNYGITLNAPWFTVCISEIHMENRTADTLLSVQNGALSLETQEKGATVFFLSPTLFVTIIRGSTRESTEERAYSFANMAQHELSGDGITLITAIGCAVSTSSSIPQTFSDAAAILRQCRFTGKNRIISTSDLQQSADTAIVLQENDPLFDRLNYADESEIDQIISEYISLLGENRSHFSIIASYLLVDVIMAVSKVIESLGGNVNDVMPDIVTHAFVERTVQSEENFIAEIRAVLTKLLAYRNEHVQGRYADVILRAKRYIEKHFASPDICLRSVAEAVALSPNHFSTVFSQDCGVTFIEYLTRVRIMQAKRLLCSTEMRSADIAYEVGFNDPHYFSFIFKKTEGMSPRDFRSKAGTGASS